MISFIKVPDNSVAGTSKLLPIDQINSINIAVGGSPGAYTYHLQLGTTTGSANFNTYYATLADAEAALINMVQTISIIDLTSF